MRIIKISGSGNESVRMEVYTLVNEQGEAMTIYHVPDQGIIDGCSEFDKILSDKSGVFDQSQSRDAKNEIPVPPKNLNLDRDVTRDEKNRRSPGLLENFRRY